MPFAPDPLQIRTARTDARPHCCKDRCVFWRHWAFGADSAPKPHRFPPCALSTAPAAFSALPTWFLTLAKSAKAHSAITSPIRRSSRRSWTRSERPSSPPRALPRSNRSAARCGCRLPMGGASMPNWLLAPMGVSLYAAKRRASRLANGVTIRPRPFAISLIAGPMMASAPNSTMRMGHLPWCRCRAAGPASSG